MQAQVFQVVSRDKPAPFDPVKPSDFSLSEGETISAQKILLDSTISLYCLDPEKKQAIFVKVPPDVNLNEVPFFYVAQYEQAVQVIKIPYDMLYHLANQIDLDDHRLILIYNMGRSGTTVTSAAFDQVDDVISFSEPDVFTQLVIMRDFSGVNDALISKLTAACMQLTCKQAAQDQQSIWSIKFRSEAIDLVDLICQSFPEAKCLFLYRNAEPWFDSYMRALGGTYLSPEQIQGVYLFGKQGCRMINAYPVSDPGEITAGLLMSLVWLDHMEHCLAMIEAGRPILPVRYEDLKANPLSVMEKIFEYCGVPPVDECALAEVFATDSQAGTVIAQDQISQKKWAFDPELLATLRQVIAEHPIVNTVDYRLPGTLTVEIKYHSVNS